MTHKYLESIVSTSFTPLNWKWKLRLQFSNRWRYGFLALVIFPFFFALILWSINRMGSIYTLNVGLIKTATNNFVVTIIELALSLSVSTVIFATIMILKNYLYTSTSFMNTGILKSKIIIWSIMLLILVVVFPIAVITAFKPSSSILDVKFWLNYFLELLVSFLVILPFVIVWWFAIRNQSLDAMLDAWEDDFADEGDIQLSSQKFSFYKWIDLGQVAGYYELREHTFNNGLHSQVQALIEEELFQAKGDKKQAQLIEQLLFFIETEQKSFFYRWINTTDNIAYYELKSQIDRHGLFKQVKHLMESELHELKDKKKIVALSEILQKATHITNHYA